MGVVVDLTRRTFGGWVVLHRVENDRHGQARWACRCTCGQEKVVTSHNLLRGGSSSCRSCCNRGNLVGQTFGHITVTESLGVASELGLRGRGQVVRGSCSCGKEWIGPATSLKRGNTRSCGCLPTGPVPRPDREAGAVRQLCRNYQRHAARRGLSWELTDRAFRELLGGDCHYCGAPPSRTNYRMTKGRRTPSVVAYNGIDRKDNTKGYTTENAVSCCAVSNFMKRDLSKEAFLEHAPLLP